MTEYTITVDEGQRQGLLMALAHLSVERPGWAPAFLDPIVMQIDNEVFHDPLDKGPRTGPFAMYEEFKKLYERDRLEACLVESHKLLIHYGELLNQRDGGLRYIPETVEAWIERVFQCSFMDDEPDIEEKAKDIQPEGVVLITEKRLKELELAASHANYD